MVVSLESAAMGEEEGFRDAGDDVNRYRREKKRKKKKKKKKKNKKKDGKKKSKRRDVSSSSDESDAQERKRKRKRKRSGDDGQVVTRVQGAREVLSALLGKFPDAGADAYHTLKALEMGESVSVSGVKHETVRSLFLAFFRTMGLSAEKLGKDDAYFYPPARHRRQLRLADSNDARGKVDGALVMKHFHDLLVRAQERGAHSSADRAAAKQSSRDETLVAAKARRDTAAAAMNSKAPSFSWDRERDFLCHGRVDSKRARMLTASPSAQLASRFRPSSKRR